ncbi:MAG: hypothetical protein COT85_00570 [Chlamydiae bacterium CG10_big_fil_rev_8_21_14_0_10_42_34]|nr:MAG: hypothetical protein COT85_00570 [Chlamydiae bacterium CG10_big_fil_rev_8_21_14_0_10_42_34]
MKKVCLFLLLITASYADEFSGELVAKIIPSENQGYFILSDGTYWKVTTFQKRWRNPLEWLVGDEIYVPENYESSLTDWIFGDEFDAYPKYGNLRVNEEDASNIKELKECSYLLVNPRTEKILFAIPLHPSDFVFELYNEGHDNGYRSGYSAGRSDGYSLGYSTGRTLASWERLQDGG